MNDVVLKYIKFRLYIYIINIIYKYIYYILKILDRHKSRKLQSSTFNIVIVSILLFVVTVTIMKMA